MNGPFKICVDGTPLTVPITDERRAAIAYNVLYHMADNGASYTMNTEETVMDKDTLSVMDAEGTAFRPDLDPEWYGTEEEKTQIRNTVPEGTEKLTLCNYDDRNHVFVRFAPETYDREKANEMFNVIMTGIDRSVSFSYEQNGQKHWFVEKGQPHNVSVVNEDNHVRTGYFERNWATTCMPDDAACSDFAAAVASISANENQLEQ